MFIELEISSEFRSELSLSLSLLAFAAGTSRALNLVSLPHQFHLLFLLFYLLPPTVLYFPQLASLLHRVSFSYRAFLPFPITSILLPSSRFPSISSFVFFPCFCTSSDNQYSIFILASLLYHEGLFFDTLLLFFPFSPTVLSWRHASSPASAASPSLRTSISGPLLSVERLLFSCWQISNVEIVSQNILERCVNAKTDQLTKAMHALDAWVR